MTDTGDRCRSNATFICKLRFPESRFSNKVIVALAHRILVIVYHLLKEHQSYRELGPSHTDAQAAESSKRWATRRLEQLGFAVTLSLKDYESLTPTDHEEVA